MREREYSQTSKGSDLLSTSERMVGPHISKRQARTSIKSKVISSKCNHTRDN